MDRIYLEHGWRSLFFLSPGGGCAEWNKCSHSMMCRLRKEKYTEARTNGVKKGFLHIRMGFLKGIRTHSHHIIAHPWDMGNSG